MITQQQLDDHTLWLKTRFTNQVQGCRLVAIDADLTDADLTDANLTRANLTRANLTRADLAGANLTRADLARANLTDADLTDADLTRANLAGVKLTDANLAGVKLTDADLTDADLTDANLTRADLTDADLTDADLTDADLTSIEADIAAILAENPTEVAGLLEALQQGRIDGTVYEGECACLVGTIAKLKSIDYRQLPYDSFRPAEVWFFAIKEGQTPASSQIAATTEQWLIKWMAANPIDIVSTDEAAADR
jgi:hypothetical protein